VRNTDDRCFLWSLIAAQHEPANGKHRARVAQDKLHEGGYDVSGIAFPMQLKDISHFEAKNGFHVHVYSYEGSPDTFQNSKVNKLYHSERAKGCTIARGRRTVP
jgi:hypothetical protein